MRENKNKVAVRTRPYYTTETDRPTSWIPWTLVGYIYSDQKALDRQIVVGDTEVLFSREY